ncbi:unnamed protein product [Periconia digitata]|uniref:Uncharacterized protein n=1 Tax=Periconia digitata TaxID=1303443 RepID=A0A9W4U6M3_9PLEO|nr:unnamed protein product [Periconia digitata]
MPKRHQFSPLAARADIRSVLPPCLLGYPSSTAHACSIEPRSIPN